MISALIICLLIFLVFNLFMPAGYAALIAVIVFVAMIYGDSNNRL